MLLTPSKIGRLGQRPRYVDISWVMAGAIFDYERVTGRMFGAIAVPIAGGGLRAQLSQSLPTACTLVIDATAGTNTAPAVSMVAGSLDDDTNTSTLRVYKNTSGLFSPQYVRLNAQEAAGSADAWTNGERKRTAMSLAANDFRSSVNGVLGTPDTALTYMTMTHVTIASNRAANGFFGADGGVVDRVTVFSGTRTNAELQALAPA